MKTILTLLALSTLFALSTFSQYFLPHTVLEGHRSEVNSVSFSPDGLILASGGWDNAIRLWDVKTGAHLRTLTGHTYEVSSVSFSPDGLVLASGSWDDTIHLWDVKTRKHLRTLKGHLDFINSVAFSPDSLMLASGSDDNTIRLWDVQTGAHLRTLIGHTSEVDSVSFSPDGLMLASGNDDHTIRLWDVETGTHLRTLIGHTSKVNSVSFSPDGLMLASGSWDGTIYLWDVETGTHLRTLTGHSDLINSISFSPDGLMLASGSWDKTVRLWDLSTFVNTNTHISITPSSMMSPVVGAQFSVNINIAEGIRGCQYFTRYWWENFAEQQFELVSSPIVQQEVSLGNSQVSQKRLEVLEKLILLDAPREMLDSLSDDLINAGALPLKARIDSFHIAIAAINSVQYLATWNFKHIANINKIPLIQQVCRKAGYQPPILCTPQQLLVEEF